MSIKMTRDEFTSELAKVVKSSNSKKVVFDETAEDGITVVNGAVCVKGIQILDHENDKYLGPRGFFDETSVSKPYYKYTDTTDPRDVSILPTSIVSADLRGLDVSELKSFYFLFNGCSNLTELNLSNWNTKSALSFEDMFWQCSKLSTLDLRSFNTDNLLSISAMVCHCRGLKSLNVKGWNTSKVKAFRSAFSTHGSGCTIIGLEDLDTSNCSNFRNLFGSGTWEFLNLSNFDFRNANGDNIGLKAHQLILPPLQNFDTSKSVGLQSSSVDIVVATSESVVDYTKIKYKTSVLDGVSYQVVNDDTGASLKSGVCSAKDLADTIQSVADAQHMDIIKYSVNDVTVANLDNVKIGDFIVVAVAKAVKVDFELTTDNGKTVYTITSNFTKGRFTIRQAIEKVIVEHPAYAELILSTGELDEKNFEYNKDLNEVVTQMTTVKISKKVVNFVLYKDIDPTNKVTSEWFTATDRSVQFLLDKAVEGVNYKYDVVVNVLNDETPIDPKESLIPGTTYFIKVYAHKVFYKDYEILLTKDETTVRDILENAPDFETLPLLEDLVITVLDSEKEPVEGANLDTVITKGQILAIKDGTCKVTFVAKVETPNGLKVETLRDPIEIDETKTLEDLFKEEENFEFTSNVTDPADIRKVFINGVEIVDYDVDLHKDDAIEIVYSYKNFYEMEVTNKVNKVLLKAGQGECRFSFKFKDIDFDANPWGQSVDCECDNGWGKFNINPWMHNGDGYQGYLGNYDWQTNKCLMSIWTGEPWEMEISLKDGSDFAFEFENFKNVELITAQTKTIQVEYEKISKKVVEAPASDEVESC